MCKQLRPGCKNPIFLFVFWMSSETEKFNGEKIPDGDAELVGDIIPTSVTVEEQREHDLQAI
jgi:hypothetical protein